MRLRLALFLAFTLGGCADDTTHNSATDRAEAEVEMQAIPGEVPEALIPFLPIVRKWGAINSDSERYELLDRAETDSEALRELKAFNDSWTPDIGEVFDEWMDRKPITESETVAQFYFTLLLLHELGFELPSDENADPVESYIEQLGEFGSKRNDSSRMWAARNLPDYGEDAKRAIPRLQEALNDPVATVRIWAHYALARLEGNEDTHRKAIRTIGKKERSEEVELQVEAALENLDRTPEQHNLEALGGFCILNDPEQIRRLAVVTDVDGIDHNGQRPMLYSVRNCHTEAVRILLEHGADPNLPERNGEAYLHSAAKWRDNGEIITMLIEHGADVNALDNAGRTPLDLAIEAGLESNADLLRSFGAIRSRHSGR